MCVFSLTIYSYFNMKRFLRKYTFKIIFPKISPILSRPQCVNTSARKVLMAHFFSSRWWLGQNGLNLTWLGGVYHRVYWRIWWWSKWLYLTLLALKPGYFTDNYANAIATDYMATQGARASRAMVLTRKYLSTKFIFYMSGICTKTRYTVHG